MLPMCHAHQTLKHQSPKNLIYFCSLQYSFPFVTTAKYFSLQTPHSRVRNTTFHMNSSIFDPKNALSKSLKYNLWPCHPSLYNAICTIYFVTTSTNLMSYDLSLVQHYRHTHQHISTTYGIFVFSSFGPSIIKPHGTKFHQSLPSNLHDCPFGSDIEVFLLFWHFKVHLQIVTHHYNNFLVLKKLSKSSFMIYPFWNASCAKTLHAYNILLAIIWFPLDYLEYIFPLIFFRCSNAQTTTNIFQLLACSFDIKVHLFLNVCIEVRNGP